MVRAMAIHDRLRGERADHHAQHAEEESRELGGEGLPSRRRHEQQPSEDAQHDRRHRALRGRARPVEAGGERNERAHERDLVGARHQVVDGGALHRDRIRHTKALNSSTVTRIVHSSRRSDCRGTNWRQMFSTNVTDGASSVADAVDLSADSSAPKNSTCITSGMRSSTSVGSTFCGSSLISVPATSGMMISALVARNIGTNANRM